MISMCNAKQEKLQDRKKGSVRVTVGFADNLLARWIGVRGAKGLGLSICREAADQRQRVEM